jgi:hypothetical protein
VATGEQRFHAFTLAHTDPLNSSSAQAYRISNSYLHQNLRGQVANVLASNGTCEAAIIDSLTGNFSDIELDAFGREVVVTTQLHPALCVP